MRSLRNKMIDECKISRDLRKDAWNKDYEGAKKTRAEQKKHWDAYNFYKNLDKALSKLEKEDK